MPEGRLPLATYRLQLAPEYGFRRARESLPRLQRLGISHLYLSPPFRARTGSTHGYDVVDPTVLSPELGGEEEFRRLAEGAARRGMGLVLDVVPNHMAVGPENPWWNDVLENGPASPYEAFFDIDWYVDELSGPKVLIPCLGRPYGRALEGGEFRLAFDEGGFVLRYFSWSFPVDPGTWDRILEQAPPDFPGREEFLVGIRALPPRTDRSPEAAAARREGKARLLERLRERRDALAPLVERMNGRAGDPRSVDALDRLVGAQAYRPAFWRVATETVEYRRFFDVSDLVGVRIERPEVFEAVHGKALELAADGLVQGLRVDHIDGLADPEAYLRRLRGRSGLPVWVEKILAPGEALPPSWPVEGTTGYEFARAVHELLVHPDGVEGLERDWSRFTGRTDSLGDTTYRMKRRVLGDLFAGELQRLGVELARLARRDRHARHHPRRVHTAALAEVTACLPVYRTYVGDGRVSPADRARLEAAVAEARARAPHVAAGAFAFLRRVLRLEFPPYVPEEERPPWERFVRRWQQLTGPVMAKGFEDTVLYVHTPLLSLNEVGGHPRAPADPVGAFHAFAAARAAATPHALNAGSTHDTKRSEDVRARLHVLSEIPAEWARRLRRWERMTRPLRRERGGSPVPDRQELAMILQSLVGIWPLHPAEREELPARVARYLEKAAREAKIHTSWLHPDAEHERALVGFAEDLLLGACPRFLDDFLPFARSVAWYGAVNGLAAALLKATAPGIPDLYQGTEAWALALVDPDNRRPVDEARIESLEDGAGRPSPAILERWPDGAVKLAVTRAALRHRAADPELWTDGTYLPVPATGARARHAVAFARRREDRWALVVVPRLPASLAPEGRWPVGAEVWGEAALAVPPDAPRRWRNVLAGTEVASERLADLLADLPVGLFEPA